MHVIIHMNKNLQIWYFSKHSLIIYFKKKCKNFCPLFKKILALKVIMHMCMKVKDRVNDTNKSILMNNSILMIQIIHFPFQYLNALIRFNLTLIPFNLTLIPFNLTLIPFNIYWICDLIFRCISILVLCIICILIA